MQSSTFYSDLPAATLSVNDLLVSESSFHAIPNDWSVIVTDIKNSSDAVGSGLSQIVNLVATGSIIAVLNITKEEGFDVPFFFGGDGATLIVPNMVLEKCHDILIQHQRNVFKEFSIHLRVGNMPIPEIYENGYDLKLAKVVRNPLFSIPIVLGNGLSFAESVIKSEENLNSAQGEIDYNLNLEGMECRWNKIPPPIHNNEVVCLLIVAVDEPNQGEVYKEVLDGLDSIYGSLDKWHPISTSRMKLDMRPTKLWTEMRVKRARLNLWELLKSWMVTVYGKLKYFDGENGKNYLESIVHMSDIFVIDGKINMVFSGTSDKRQKLVDMMQKMEESGKLLYGMHVSTESIISCYVRDRNAQHIHFVDGSNGGYTMAAKQLKSKLSAKS